MHFKYEGAMMVFLLYIIEFPESHSGATLEQEFPAMFECFNVEDKSVIHIEFYLPPIMTMQP